MIKIVSNTLIFVLSALFFSTALSAQNTSGSLSLDSYLIWRNNTSYTKTYVVDQGHPEASDENPGTFDQPFMTIHKAAKVVKAGERVLIYSGVYKEMIQPKYEGTVATKMISYESAPGKKVVVKGSRILGTEWIQRRVKTDVIEDTALTYTWSRKI